MKLKDKRFWMLLILMANAFVASAQAVFTVEEIGKEEYLDAEKECMPFNAFPTDSIAEGGIVNRILKEAQSKFEKLDSITRQGIYESADEEEFGFDKRRLLHIPELRSYGFLVPDTPSDGSAWWFDSESGQYLCSGAAPTAINANGSYVSQRRHDCDWPLELRFFRRHGNVLYESETYKNARYNGESVVFQQENEIRPIFWHGDNTLFLKTFDHESQKEVYLKIVSK